MKKEPTDPYSFSEVEGLGASLILSYLAQQISMVMVNQDPFSIPANFISRLFSIGFMMLEINCLYLMTHDYHEPEWVILNSVFLGLMLINTLGSLVL